MYKAIIYDIDGTLLNTLDMNMYPLLQIIEEELGEKWTFDDVLKFASYPGMKVMEELQVKEPEIVYARWVKYVLEYPGGAQPFEGVNELLETMAPHFKQAVVSSKTRQQYSIECQQTGIGRYMEVSIMMDDTVHHKPHPEPLLACIEKLGVNKEEVLYIGDTYSDFLATQNAGIDFALAKWGCLKDEGMEESKYKFNTPLELVKELINEKK